MNKRWFYFVYPLQEKSVFVFLLLMRCSFWFLLANGVRALAHEKHRLLLTFWHWHFSNSHRTSYRLHIRCSSHCSFLFSFEMFYFLWFFSILVHTDRPTNRRTDGALSFSLYLRVCVIFIHMFAHVHRSLAVCVLLERLKMRPPNFCLECLALFLSSNGNHLFSLSILIGKIREN